MVQSHVQQCALVFVDWSLDSATRHWYRPQVFFPCTAMAVISVMDVSVIPGYCTGCCGYRHWYLLLLSREQELQNHGIFQKHGASGKSCYLSVFFGLQWPPMI